ncbi:glycosyltransferase family 2 protein [Lactiplantibacillus fabifermentans]|uniref:Glycosyltransferase n=1 Tax=Lactiplantibacillus fabifermentans DSM 21115 TaxID=1413187 RepID=A0A0R2NXG4_9LACO|nr:glycosyltransferase family 2 protein [Lactiplantibacillus fabifermentans]KRO27626.1 glycosyltransferase [Lactiplantibacillus fabifermentans DSM 21115]
MTYNRLELLKECLTAINNQTTPVDKVMIVNNCSTDGTQAYLASIESATTIVYNSDTNMGGAGGFSAGLKLASQRTNCDYFWIMDDDTIPHPDCLESLLKHADDLHNRFGFLASNVRWKDGTPTNLPMIGTDWSTKVANGLIELQTGSFVSLLVQRRAVHQVGLPYKQFFIWDDDAEYTMRLGRLNPGYMCADALVTHKSAAKGVATGVVKDVPERISRYFYLYRNDLFIQKHYNSHAKVVRTVLHDLTDALRCLLFAKDRRFQRFSVVLKGLFAGLNFNPTREEVE